MQESKPFVALAKTDIGWAFVKCEVPLPYTRLVLESVIGELTPLESLLACC